LPSGYSERPRRSANVAESYRKIRVIILEQGHDAGSRPAEDALVAKR